MDGASPSTTGAPIEELREALQRSQRHPVRLIETHVSWVLLGDDEAYKVKKPVRLPFLDFGSLPSRRLACEEELRLNRALAPTLYRDVVAIRRASDGKVAFGGSGETVEYAVRMRRFLGLIGSQLPQSPVMRGVPGDEPQPRMVRRSRSPMRQRPAGRGILPNSRKKFAVVSVAISASSTPIVSASTLAVCAT